MSNQQLSKIFISAFISSIIALILLGVTFGIKLEVVGVETLLETRYLAPIIGVVIVFTGSLVLDMFPLFISFLNKEFPGFLSSIPFLRQIKEKISRETINGDILSKYKISMPLIILLIALPFILRDKLYIGMFVDIYIYIILALGLNMVVGYAGLLNIGYIAFYAIGAYTFGILNHFFGWSFWICLPLSALSAALAGFILGLPVLRLRGDYLAIVTLGFGEVINILLKNLDSLTMGPKGIGPIDRPMVFGLEFSKRAKQGGTPFHEFFGIDYIRLEKDFLFYFIALMLLIFSVVVINKLRKMPIGRSWEAFRENELACKSLGLNPTRIKLSAFIISSAFAGLAGCFFAAKQAYITPESFEFIESVIILSIVVLGGMGSRVGVIVAAVFVAILKDYSQDLEQYRMVIFSIIIIVMMLWRPQGLFPSKREIMGDRQ